MEGGPREVPFLYVAPGVTLLAAAGAEPLDLRARCAARIDGRIDLSGADGEVGGRADPGRGGGGRGGPGGVPCDPGFAGEGPGGGPNGAHHAGGAGAGHAAPGDRGGAAYGDDARPALEPGSGGGGVDSLCANGDCIGNRYFAGGPSGGAGGGAVRVRSRRIDVGGVIGASGGGGGSGGHSLQGGGGGGSGGTIWLSADTVAVTGTLRASGGGGGGPGCNLCGCSSSGGNGAPGRIWIETAAFERGPAAAIDPQPRQVAPSP